MKRLLAAMLAVSALALLGGCGGGENTSSTSSAPASSAPTASASSASSAPAPEQKDVALINKITIEGELPASAPASSAASSAPAPAASTPAQIPEVSVPGQELSATELAAEMDALYAGTGKYADLPVAVLDTSEGTIRIRLFPEQAPKAVENFVTHAKNGYYDGLTFHRVINDFMLQGGDPDGTGTGGVSIWGEPFVDEPSFLAHNFRGSLSMANAGANTNGSQFFIVQNKTPLTEAEWEQQLTAIYQNYFGLRVSAAQQLIFDAETAGKPTEEVDKLVEELNAALTVEAEKGMPESFKTQMQPVYERYAAQGGTPYLDYKHTVFGFVIEGMDVVDQIAAKYGNG